jgi:hypothetical protein
VLSHTSVVVGSAIFGGGSLNEGIHQPPLGVLLVTRRPLLAQRRQPVEATVPSPWRPGMTPCVFSSTTLCRTDWCIGCYGYPNSTVGACA